MLFTAVGYGPPKCRRTMVHVVNQEQPVRAGRRDAGREASDAKHIIAALGDARNVRLLCDAHTELPLPATALVVLKAALSELATGRRVTIVPVDAEMTTQQAADILLVSRPFLVGLLDAGKIPYRKVGTKRRLLATDVLDYKAKEDKRRDACLDDLAAEGQRLGLY
jgi:excisionase family DNA binding protein